MGLDMYFYKIKNEEREEIAYWSKSYYPLHHWIKSHVGEIECCKSVTLSKELLLELRDVFIDVLQNATDGQTVTDNDYVKKCFKIYKDKDINEFFVWFLNYTIKAVSDVIYYTDFNTERVVYWTSW